MPIDDTRPIWAQIADEVTTRILTGEWPPGHRIPSVRELAVTHGVNPNTVQRALTAVDTTGLTRTERASGRLVTTDTHTLDAARRARAADATRSWITTMRALGISRDAAHALLDDAWDADTAPPTP